MEIKSLNKNTMIAEACCGEGDISKKSELTEQEHTQLRAAKIKVEWLKKMIPKGLSAKFAYEGEEEVGFIEYMPIELSNFHKGKGLYIINCMVAPHTLPWGGPHRERIPGCGSTLVQAMIKDVQGKCKGIVTPFGFAYTEDMKGFFAKLGFEEFENDGLTMLIRKFEDVKLPSPIHYKQKYQFRQVSGKVIVDIFWSSKCPADPYTLVNLQEVCNELSNNNLILNEFCVDEREALEKYGIAGGTYVNGKFPWSTYGPLEKEEIRETLEKILGVK